VNRTRRRAARSGCSGLGALIVLIVAIFAVFGWPIYLESQGTAASGVITEKRESVRIVRDEWFRRFEVIAAYSIPSQPLQRRAICDVDERTYDSLHLGNTVAVHYFAGLLNQPFLPATHLAPCSTAASISTGSLAIRRFVVVFLGLLAILFFWRVLRIRIAAWLLLPWLCLSFAYIALPRVEPEPRHPVPATATVDSVTTITTLGDLSRQRSIPLQRPYQIVRLKFVPPGMDSPVTAIDKVDAGSVPNLIEGQSANIVYDVEHPRVARLQEGTRLFPGQTLNTVLLCCAAYIVLVAIAGAIKGFFRLIGRRRL
jgi:hypothetical protein